MSPSPGGTARAGQLWRCNGALLGNNIACRTFRYTLRRRRRHRYPLYPPPTPTIQPPPTFSRYIYVYIYIYTSVSTKNSFKENTHCSRPHPPTSPFPYQNTRAYILDDHHINGMHYIIINPVGSGNPVWL